MSSILQVSTFRTLCSSLSPLTRYANRKPHVDVNVVVRLSAEFAHNQQASARIEREENVKNTRQGVYEK